MTARETIRERMLGLEEALQAAADRAQEHTTEYPDEWGSAQFDRGYHAALMMVLDTLDGTSERTRDLASDDERADYVLHEIHCYVDSPDNWPDEE